jgi:hypothetical protein
MSKLQVPATVTTGVLSPPDLPKRLALITVLTVRARCLADVDGATQTSNLLPK